MNPIGPTTAFGQALRGIQRGMDDLRQASAEIARRSTQQPPAADNDYARPLVDLGQAGLNTQAAAHVLTTEDQTLGYLLDVHA